MKAHFVHTSIKVSCFYHKINNYMAFYAREDKDPILELRLHHLLSITAKFLFRHRQVHPGRVSMLVAPHFMQNGVPPS